MSKSQLFRQAMDRQFQQKQEERWNYTSKITRRKAT